ncbi:hypothetical protein [Secundilactobacillus paracollinoides]|uniref:hypothetical protein n=1 Tax=Secundilactobacillus paracollinoides TaxID=240427 RepID=UPI000A9922CA|nr:hypothetical protein [Secundilactobacillus paracollinoides]
MKTKAMCKTIILSVLSFVIVVTVNLNQSFSIQAKTTHTTPTASRGDWYHYYRGTGYEAFKITAHTFSVYESGHRIYHVSPSHLNVTREGTGYNFYDKKGSGDTLRFRLGMITVKNKKYQALSLDN